MAFSLPPPKRVSQGNRVTCWAAALESWLIASKRAATPQEGLVSVYGRKSGSLNPITFPLLASDYKMVFDYAGVNPEWSGADVRFHPLYIEDILKNNGYIYLSYNLLSQYWWHVNVLYGVGKANGYETVYKVMDPEPDAGFVNKRISDFFTNYTKYVYVGYGRKKGK